jgi:uroporphyrinogen decarboxylase
MRKPKERLQMVLDGVAPEAPPHWELVYQIEDKVFGLDRPGDRNEDREIGLNIKLMTKMVETYEWAAIYPAKIGPVASLKGIRTLKKELGNHALVAGYEWDGVFWMPPGDKFVDLAVLLFEKPEELHRLARMKCEKAKAWLAREAGAGADFFVLAHDFGFNSGPFISPEHFGEFVIPYLTEIVHSIHDMGLKAILHSDGDLRLLLDQIYSTGIDGYQSVDPQGSMDIKQVRADYPEWILMGNVKSSMLQDTIETEIRESVRYCMKHGGVGKRYIFSTSNCIFKGMPVKSYEIMLDEYHRIIEAHQKNHP